MTFKFICKAQCQKVAQIAQRATMQPMAIFEIGLHLAAKYTSVTFVTASFTVASLCTC